MYGVIGAYDFVSIVEAPDNDAAARFSLEFRVRAGVQVETLPAAPIGEFKPQEVPALEAAAAAPTLEGPVG